MGPRFESDEAYMQNPQTIIEVEGVVADWLTRVHCTESQVTTC